MKLLIIDDDRAHVRATGIVLRDAGYEIVAAVDAVGAISTAVRERPDLILLDLGLPGGNGLVVLERLQMNLSLAGLPVIVVSASNADSNRKAVMAAGASAILQKPVDNATLLDTIAAVLKAAKGGSRSPGA